MVNTSLVCLPPSLRLCMVGQAMLCRLALNNPVSTGLILSTRLLMLIQNAATALASVIANLRASF